MQAPRATQPSSPLKASAATTSALQRLTRQALLLRLGLAVVLHVTTSDYTFAPDQETYHLFSVGLARYWSGESLLYPGRLQIRGEPIGYYYIVASLYFVLGAWPLIPKLLNAVMGTLTVRLAFDLAFRITSNERTALRTATYVAWFPSLVLWSVLNIRDVWVVMLILLISRQALVVHAQPAFTSLLSLAAGIYFLTLFRPYMLFAAALPILVSFVIRQRRHLARNAILGMFVAGAVIYADASAGLQRRMRLIDFEDLNNSRKWSSSAARSGFEAGADISTPAKALAFLPIGLTYFMLAPFPWTITNFRQAFTLPEMLYFYWLFPAIVRGIGVLARRHLSNSLSILLMSAGITFGYAVGQGNVGTIYRHRAQVLPFFLIFAAAGIEAGRTKALAGAVLGARRERVQVVS